MCALEETEQKDKPDNWLTADSECFSDTNGAWISYLHFNMSRNKFRKVRNAVNKNSCY